jgi:peptidoglycan biosynthesis protein MviN/MurJ (putative lipid II flippase)
VVNVVVGIALVGPLGLAGLATAIAVGAWIEVVVLMVLLERRMPGLGLGAVWLLAARSLLAAAGGAATALLVVRVLETVWGVEPGALLVLVRVVLASGLGAGAILAISLALRIEEPRAIAGLAGGLLRRRASPSGAGE